MLVLVILLAACGKAPPVTVTCADPRAGCQLPGGLELRFSRQPAVMQSFDLDVAAPADAAPYVSFQMRGMEMGLNRYRLLRKNGRWHASVMLPACVQGRRDWVLRLEAGGKVYEMPFVGS